MAAKRVHLYTAVYTLPRGLIAHLGKWDGLFARLLLTYHVIEHAGQEEFPSSLISETTAKSVSGFMREFLLAHALVFYMEILNSHERTDNLRWIAGYILSKNLVQLTTRNLQRHFKKWENFPEWERRELLRVFVDAGWLETFGDSRDELNRMPTRFHVNPHVHELYKSQAETERQRRAATIEMLSKMIGFKVSPQETKVDNEGVGT